MKLNFDVHPGDGPYLLLVHGFLMSAAQWAPNLAALSQFCRPVVVELWGHGDSPAPADAASYLPNSYIEAFENIRRSLRAGPWLVCGYSLGAGLSIGYALRYPQQVIGHVFTNSTSAFADATQIQAWRSGADQAAAQIEADGIAAIERMPVHPRHARRLPAPLYDALCQDAGRLNPRGIANTLRYTNPNASVRDRIGGNSRPALLICGSLETRFQPHRGYAEQHMPALSIVDLPVGHGVNFEDHDGFNAAVARFVRTVRPPMA